MRKLLIMSLLVCVAKVSGQQETPPLPFGQDDDKNPLLDLLNTEFMKRAQDAKPSDQRYTQPRAGRGKAQKPVSPSIDYKEFLGPGADPDATLRALQDKGLIPKPNELTKSENDLWQGVPPEKRLAFAEERLSRNEAGAALLEIDRVLQTKDLEADLLRKAIHLRIRALFKTEKYEACQDTLLRYKTYFPEDENLEETEGFVYRESGLDVYQQQVRKSPNDEKTLKQLLHVYGRFKWDDLAVRFLEDEFPEPGVAICCALASTYYKRKDYRKLVAVSKKAGQLEPNIPRHLYNQAVGLFHLKDPISMDRARGLLNQAKGLAKDRTEIERINWYLSRLPQSP